MNMRILRALLRKEFKMMRSNPLVPKVIIGMPLMVMLVLPLVANLDVKRVAVAVVDDDHSRLSERVVADLDAPAAPVHDAPDEGQAEAPPVTASLVGVLQRQGEESTPGGMDSETGQPEEKTLTWYLAAYSGDTLEGVASE